MLHRKNLKLKEKYCIIGIHIFSNFFRVMKKNTNLFLLKFVIVSSGLSVFSLSDMLVGYRKLP